VSETITVSKEELRELVKEAVKDAFGDVGLRADKPEQVDEAREDFRFIRLLRKSTYGAASTVGVAVIVSVVGGAITILSLGARALLGK
jgi:tellurite resistance protein